MTVTYEEQAGGGARFRLFGLHIQHSKAPLLHNFLFKRLGLENWKYELFESNNVDEFKKYLQEPGTIGSAVTMPNKVTMIDHVDVVDDGAKAVGAINTIYTKREADDKIIVGTNTDTIGIHSSFVYNTPDQVKQSQESSLPGLVYGGGGACRSAVYALHDLLHCSKVYIINRYESEVVQVMKAMKQGGFKGEIVHIKNPDEAEQIANRPKLIVLTVPDFEPVSPEETLAKQTLDVFIQDGKGAVLEMCYHPNPTTRLYKEFESHNWKVISGIEAMIYQGIAQQVFWTGVPIDKMPVKEVIDYIYLHLDH
ncbi:NAD(P)-binding protein [Hyphopichia burtonii NRRL Y-1933]|uniref:NAD(P)-binding protein n=1 Tax=Hyphopichia burtonii NRRL Y-1933 TaxID=984485 RepID=A0A1E4RMH0_9ASCO|nr:NAD(P)-binding protein [Hyphopichia burtonii NRRL Y-1933]ODV68464.1 NAD(P)-binding protein [Hyphopichia burtonii NRRL Y-1933]